MEFLNATKNDVKNIYNIISQCADVMAQKGLMHWIPYYPEDRILDDINNKIVYIVKEKDMVIATFTLLIDNKVMYLSKLAVKPDVSGKGIGTKCLSFIEKKCEEENIKLIKLDVYNKSIEAIKFYEKNGYKKIGEKPTRRFIVFIMEKELI